MSFGNVDGDFDQYRRERLRHGRIGADNADSYENSALRELEQVEAREIRDQVLTREVHEFFASATKQAATIVERMAHDAEAEADQRITGEMESFLIDSLGRMNSLVIEMLNKRRGKGGEELLEPNVNNIVGKALDAFRDEGTAELDDKHIGQDPFALDLEDVRRELLDSCAGGEIAPLEGEVPDAERDDESMPEPQPEPESMYCESPAEVDAEVDVGDDAEAAVAPPAAAPASEPQGHVDHDLERFKEALRSLVRQGTMSREEARAAWATRLQSLGIG